MSCNILNIIVPSSNTQVLSISIIRARDTVKIATGKVAQEMNQKRFRGERNGRAHRGRHKVHSFTSSLILLLT